MTTTSPLSRRPRATALSVAALVGAATLLAALTLGPRPLPLAEERTGDPVLAGHLAELAEPGHHHLGAFTLTEAGQATFAGLGGDEHVEFEVGSVTKTFTAEILRNQIAAGRVSEDTAVGQIIDAGSTPVADVTLGELARHTSGLPRLAGLNPLTNISSGFLGTNPYEGVNRDDVIDAALSAELSGRGQENYSNFGFALLGQLLAVEADTSYEQLVHDQILGPLDMADTYLMTPGSVPDDAPRGYLPSGREAEPWEMDGYNPAGGVRSTPADMARYTAHLLEQGLPDYTWVRDDAGFHWHNGATYGYSTMLIVDPGQERAVLAFTDSSVGVESLAGTLFREAS